VTEAGPEDREAAVEDLAAHLHRRFGAPSLEAARDAAREEVDFAASLCQHEAGTLLALHRTLEGGEIREQFRALAMRDAVPAGDRLHAHARVFEFVEVDEERTEERVDLAGMMETKRA
jgi:hypothetical protein